MSGNDPVCRLSLLQATTKSTVFLKVLQKIHVRYAENPIVYQRCSSQCRAVRPECRYRYFQILHRREMPFLQTPANVFLHEGKELSQRARQYHQSRIEQIGEIPNRQG